MLKRSIVLSAFVIALSAHAAEIVETRLVTGIPSESDVREWSSDGVARNYRFEIDIDLPLYTDRILALKNARSIAIVTNVYPTDRSLALWQRLAAAGVRFEGQGDLIFPTTAQAARINAINFSGLSLRFEKFPEADKGELLGMAALTTPFALVFAADRYPFGVDLENFKALPALVGLRFVTSYWPRQNQVDLLNQLSVPFAFEVIDFVPTSNDLPYLKSLARLESVTLSLDAAPWKREFWSALQTALPTPATIVTWKSRGVVPERADIEAFFSSRAASGERSLVLDDTTDLDNERREAIEAGVGTVERVVRVERAL